NMIFRIQGHDNLHVRTVWLDVYKGGVIGNLSSSEIYLDQLVVATGGQIGPWSPSRGGTTSPTAQTPPASSPPTGQTAVATPPPPQRPRSPAPPASSPAPAEASAQSPSPTPPAGIDLGNNEWRLLNPKPSQRYLLGNWPATDVLSGQETPTSRVYSGIHY